MLKIKCMKCSKDQGKNVLFEVKEFDFPVPLPNRMREAKCPICGFEILIEGDGS